MDEELSYEEPSEPWFSRWAILLTLAAILVMLWIFRAILHTVHIHFLDQLAYPHFTEDGDEVTSDISFAGWYIIIVTLMIATRLLLILKRGFRDHMEREESLMWNTWFIGLTVYTVFVYALDAAIPRDAPGRWLVWPVLTASVAVVCYRIYKALLRAPDARS